jgi:hypothetical protein
MVNWSTGRRLQWEQCELKNLDGASENLFCDELAQEQRKLLKPCPRKASALRYTQRHIYVSVFKGQEESFYLVFY